MTRRILRARSMIFAAALLALDVARAGRIETYDARGGPPPAESTDEAAAEAEYNPKMGCRFENGSTIDAFLGCFVETANTPCDPPARTQRCVGWAATQAYVATRLPPPLTGVNIQRTDSTEIDDLSFYESSLSIGWTKLFVDRPGLVAMIQEVQEVAGGGWISVRINDWRVQVSTEQGDPPHVVNNRLAGKIREGGFKVEFLPPYLRVTAPKAMGGNINRVEWQSFDRGIFTSGIALLPVSGLIY